MVCTCSVAGALAASKGSGEGVKGGKQSLVQRREEEFLGRVDAFAITEVLNRVHLESEGVQFKLAMEREMQDLRLVLAEQNEELLLSFQEMIAAVGKRS